MKKYLMILLIMGMIGLASATLSVSNYIDSKPIKDKPFPSLDVWDANLILPNEKLMTHDLDSNTGQCLYDCNAIGETELYSDGVLFDNMRFVGGQVKDSHIYIVEPVDSEVEVPDYEQQCEYSEHLKGDECHSIIVGTHTEIKTDYKIMSEYHIGDILPAGHYYWKIVGDKNAYENVDWQLSSGGVWLTPYAWWYGVTPTGYWKFNESSGDATDSSGGGALLTNSGVTYSAAMLGNGADFTSGDTLTNTTSLAKWTMGSSVFTVAFWIKSNTITGYTGIMTTDTGWHNADDWSVITSTTGQITFQCGVTSLDSSAQIDDNAWHRVVFVRADTSPTGLQIYIDNVLDSSLNCGTNLNNARTFVIGNAPAQGNFVGSLDDLQIYNGYAFTVGDVATDWNSGAGREADSKSNIKMYVNLTTPAINSQFLPPTNVELNATCTGDSGINVTSVYFNVTDVNGVFNKSHTISSLNNATYNATWTTSYTIGTYNWSVICYGAEGNNATSENRTFKVANPEFKLCNGTGNQVINISFIDESTSTAINASISTSAFNFYTTGFYSFLNLTNNTNYEFCFYPSTLNGTSVNGTIYYYLGGYPQRQFSFSDYFVNSSTRNYVLPLLGTGSGQYVSFIVVTPARVPISGANIQIQTVAMNLSGTTDASGTYTAFLSPTTSTTVITSKAGFGNSSVIIFPTQTTYTIIMGGNPTPTNISTNLTTNYNYKLYPLDYYLTNDTAYDFILSLGSLYGIPFNGMNITLWGDGLTLIGSNSSAGGLFGNVSLRVNTYSNNSIYGLACWNLTEGGNTYSNCLWKQWTIINTKYTRYSISHGLSDLNTYLAGDGMFGLKTGFSMNIIIFIIILLVVGVMSYSYGLYSPVAVSGMVFTLVLLFDTVLGLITFPVQYMPTVLTGLIFFAIVLKEVTGY